MSESGLLVLDPIRGCRSAQHLGSALVPRHERVIITIENILLLLHVLTVCTAERVQDPEDLCRDVLERFAAALLTALQPVSGVLIQPNEYVTPLDGKLHLIVIDLDQFEFLLLLLLFMNLWRPKEHC